MHAALYLGLMVTAALAFTIGGVFMKWSNGLTQTLPTLAMLVLFAIGATLLTLSIDVRGELGPAYLVVLGLEAILALALGALVFGENASAPRLFGLVLLIAGMILIEATSAPEPTAVPAAERVPLSSKPAGMSR
jgi:small multidrug resistance pump/quaternary ammonium compound-resistance protein SugE